ncbi:hypothetical protein J2128_001291 [Methanomicrobium sp. W14]|uniref:DUF7090 family protein n=1 Tax=Methanomicrobium sp. W14 TaxID=2817839 RepID=UPI001AE82BB5|nr:hypothetical protein [Methanomicrobium sp. W14]MBP2133337.1 hypothetical protein [Methanomicrobium sp. W14]
MGNSETEEYLNKDKKPHIWLVLSPPEMLKENNIGLIKEITKSGQEVIIISASQPAQYLYEVYTVRNLDLEKITFIDTISKFAMGKVNEKVPKCTYLTNPGDLTAISIAVSEELKKKKDQNPALLLDSINAMLIYIPSSNITKFIHFITSKLRIMDLSGIYLAAESTLDPAILSQLTAFADKFINMDGKTED